MEENLNFQKYLSYKNKYLNLKKIMQKGGNNEISVVSYNVFGTNEKGKHIDKRLPEIVKEIFKNGAPDVICLQEATQDVIDAIVRDYPDYTYRWTKLEEVMRDEEKKKADGRPQLEPRKMTDLLNEGYMCILSKIAFKEKVLVYGGSYLDDGIMKVLIVKNGKLISIYNVHTSGGTFGKLPHVVRSKQIHRIYELGLLNRSIDDEMHDASRGINKFIIMGDFNYDSNDLDHYPEGKMSPEYIFDELKDVWKVLKPCVDIGATEDEVINTFRSSMKIKAPKDLRQCRYDKIISSLTPTVIEMIGNEAFGEQVVIPGKDETGKKQNKTAQLFPSDHFGLYCKFNL